MVQEFDDHDQTRRPNAGINSTASNMFDNSDQLQHQIFDKKREIEMKTAMEIRRLNYLRQANQSVRLEDQGFPPGSVYDTEGLNALQMELRQQLLNPDNEHYRANDSVYEKFRATIREREAFNNEVK